MDISSQICSVKEKQVNSKKVCSLIISAKVLYLGEKEIILQSELSLRMDDRRDEEQTPFATFLYEGELDHLGFACGEGRAVKKDDPNHTLTGTWHADKPHGICKFSIQLICVEFSYRHRI